MFITLLKHRNNNIVILITTIIALSIINNNNNNDNNNNNNKLIAILTTAKQRNIFNQECIKILENFCLCSVHSQSNEPVFTLLFQNRKTDNSQSPRVVTNT